MNTLMIFITVLVAVISIILVWFNLPGTFVFLLLVFCLDYLFKTTSESYIEFSENSFIMILVIFLLAEIIEFILSAIMVKNKGGKNSSAFLSILGAIIGAIIGNFIFPIIGAIIGLIIGSYFMTYYNEKNLGRSSQEASEIAISTTLGYLIGKFMKSLLIIISLFYLFLY